LVLVGRQYLREETTVNDELSASGESVAAFGKRKSGIGDVIGMAGHLHGQAAAEAALEGGGGEEFGIAWNDNRARPRSAGLTVALRRPPHLRDQARER
jgi:hypothetical protein